MASILDDSLDRFVGVSESITVVVDGRVLGERLHLETMQLSNPY